ncbi:glucosaminidase domain-containing protein [Bacteroides acidifaciens]|uniref:glucosaminidase domain-containing protein n=1 Tax=Bacteroides acidifaciens TaxID=85831 RepID=UPI003014277C
MRKKFVKSSRPTYKKRIRKGQTGMKFASYNVVETPKVDITDITNPVNPFSEYNFSTTYDKPEALVVPTREDSKPDTIEKTSVATDAVINKPVASKPVTANSTWKSPYTNRRQWTTELINAYKKAGITNDNAIRMLLAQDALESSWGKSAQGKYNFGNLTTGSSWKGDYVTGNDKNAKGEAIKQKFRSYNSMDEYAADKIQFLKRLYDFDENDDINKFVAKLTGSNKGKRRYAEATNYAKVLTGVYNGIPKGENGMIIKYQEPAHGIARRDAIMDYRPELPLSPIKQPVKPYMPTQQPVLSPDNRTGWEKEVSRQIKADRAKNDNLYSNQHTWNWSAPFTNTRITKDNASAMFDFDKSAAMSTFAIGQGIASPVTTATSIAGSLVGAGIGKQVAGDKGALVGGFVGGLLGDRTLNAVRHAKNANKNIGVVSEYYKNPDNPLLSEVDWRGWSKGGEISKEHLAEYAAIERAAKANDTWLKTRDGEPWKGDKRTWIQLMSKDGEKFRHGEFPSNRDVWYNGVPNDGMMLHDYPTYTGDTWLADRYEAALLYSKTMKGQVFHIGVPKGTKIKGFDAHGDKFSEVRLPDGTRMKTDRIVDEVKATGKYDATYIKDVDETWGFKPNDDLILHSGTPRKSLIGNNGDFDLSNPNIYKALMPFLIGGTTYGFNGRNVDKQTTKKNN